MYSATKAQVYTPFHLNSALIRFDKFKDNNYFLNQSFEDRIVEQIRLIQSRACEPLFKPIDIKQLKAALWSICSMCNCEEGFKYLQLLNDKYKLFSNILQFVVYVIKIAEDYPVLSMRGSSFFCLNYLCKTNTGANLMGKLGWHTFQPNRGMETKAFYSILSSFTNEQLDLKYFYSSLDTAVMLYNLNRGKTRSMLKQIKMPESPNRLSTEEKEFLNKQAKVDILNRDYMGELNEEAYLLRVGFFHENLAIPIRASLLSVEVDFKLSEVTCCSELTDTIQAEIIGYIMQLTPLFNIEKTKLALSRLKQQHPQKFDACLHGLVTRNVLSTRKIKFHFRKLIQELFLDMTPLH